MSEFLQWNQSFDLGIGEMNDEHKQLINIMNKLYTEAEQKASRESLAHTVKDLVTYTLKHFSDDEAYMARVGYPKQETHKLIHKDLVPRFQKHIEHFEKFEVLQLYFFDFLQLWLSAHIR